MSDKKATIKREDAAPYYWIARDESGNKLDRDKYQNDLIPRLEGLGYQVEKIGT